MKGQDRAPRATHVHSLETAHREPGRPETAPSTRRTSTCRSIRGGSQPGLWKRGLVLAALALLLSLFFLLHSRVPNRVGNLGSLVETFLPWFGLLVPVLLVAGVWRRSASAVAALLVPVLVWLSLFGGQLIEKPRWGGDLIVASHNVDADNRDPTGTAHALVASGADVLALEELTPRAQRTYEKELAKAYPYDTAQGTVGLWSKLPLSDIRPVDVEMDYGPLADTIPINVKMASNRALRATVTTGKGPLTVLVAHLGSARVNPQGGFVTTQRDRGAQALSKAITAEQSTRVVLLGDLNGTINDRAFGDITAQLRSAQDAAGDGFGFSWPAGFPVVRIDQILVRGVDPKRAWVLPATGSDHRPVAAAISW